MATRDEFATSNMPDPIVPAVRTLPSPSPLNQSSLRRHAVSAEPQVPRSLGSRVGVTTRNNTNAAIGLYEGVANASAQPARVLGGVARDAYRGFNGAPNLQEGQPLAARFDLPRLPGAPKPGPVGSAAAAGGVSTASAASIPGAAAPAGPRVLPTLTVRPQPGDITRSTDANGSPVFSGTGTPTQPGARTLLGTVAAPRNMAPEARAASIETQRDITNNATGASEVVGASALNGLSPQSELMRRFEISQGGFKGSPSARRMAGEAILGTIGQMNGATVAGAAGASQAALAGQEDQVAGNENFARRRFDASKFNVDTGEARDARDMVGRTFNRTLDAADGTTSALSNDGTLTPLKNSDGTSFRQLPDPSRRTTVSPDAEFRALSEELTALAQTPGEGSMVRAAQIQTRMEQLTGQGALSAKGPTLEAFLTAARKANPQASQDELTSYFNRTYGS